VKGYEPRMQRTSQARRYKLGQSSRWLLHHLSGSSMMALMPCAHAEYCLCVVMMRAFARADRSSASWAVSFTPWRLGVGGHGGDDDGDARDCIAEAEQCDRDGDV